MVKTNPNIRRAFLELLFPYSKVTPYMSYTCGVMADTYEMLGGTEEDTKDSHTFKESIISTLKTSVDNLDIQSLNMSDYNTFRTQFYIDMLCGENSFYWVIMRNDGCFRISAPDTFIYDVRDKDDWIKLMSEREVMRANDIPEFEAILEYYQNKGWRCTCAKYEDVMESVRKRVELSDTPLTIRERFIAL